MVPWMARNPRRTRAGVSLAGKAGLLPGKPLIGGQAAGEPELGEGGQDEPGPAVGGGRIAEFRAGPAQGLLEEPERVLISKRRRNACQHRSASAGPASGREVHSHTGFGARSWGR